jgi:hypothetical protein
MKQTKLWIIPVMAALCAAALTLASCGMNKAEVERSVASRFQTRLDTDRAYSGYGMKVKTVSLVKSGSHTYNGYATVVLDGETHDIGIAVTVDGGNIIFETKPSAFAFLTEKAPVQAFVRFMPAFDLDR